MQEDSLQLFGPPARFSGESLIPLPPERLPQLATLLAVCSDWQPRERIAAMFWPDLDNAAARRNLRHLLFKGTQQWPSLEVLAGAVRLNIDTDVRAFESAHEARDFARAVALYRGPFADGLELNAPEPFDAWVRFQRNRLAALFRASAAQRLAQVGDAAGRERLAREWLKLEPLDEEPLIALVEAVAASGRTNEAQRIAAEFSSQLTTALAVDPSARVRALVSATPAATAAGPSPEIDTEAATEARGFIGRGAELRELQALLARDDCRVLTITGPGGIGKSRLVKQAARVLAAKFPDGVTWIALDDLTDTAQLATRIGSELGLDPAPRQNPVDRIAAHLAARHTLLVIDNAEPSARLARLVERLLTAAPKLRVLITSRSRVGVDREWLLPLAGLAVPAPDASAADIVAADAVRLFVAQAQATDPRFGITHNESPVAELVRAVGGMPLAILLAAGWVRLLPMKQLLDEVRMSLDVLERTEEGDERPEHRSVRATLEQSWQLLAPAEQQALAALSVMAGSFRRNTASAVAQAPLALLATLVDKSLLQVDVGGRFSLHPLIQQFAAEKLALEPCAPDAVRDRHAEHFAQFMSEYRNFDTVDQPAALHAIASEFSNVLAAWNWSIARTRIDLLQLCSSGLSNYFQGRGPVATGVEVFARAQSAIEARAGETTGPARDACWSVTLEHASLKYWLGEYRQVEVLGRKALEAARAVESEFGTRTSLNTVALALMRQGRFDEAADRQEEALAHAKAARVAWEIPAYAGNLVAIKRELGDDRGALSLAHQALDGHHSNGHRRGEISMLGELGQIHHGLGQLDEAIEWYERGLRLTAGPDMDLWRAHLLTHLASACLDTGQIERAMDSGREALRTVVQGGLLAHEPVCRCTVAVISLAAGDATDARRQLTAAIAAARHIGTALVIVPLLRDCAAFVAAAGDAAVALSALACADRHRVSRAALLARYRDQRERLRDRLQAGPRDVAEAHGASLSLTAGLDLVERALAAG